MKGERGFAYCLPQMPEVGGGTPHCSLRGVGWAKGGQRRAWSRVGVGVWDRGALVQVRGEPGVVGTTSEVRQGEPIDKEGTCPVKKGW